ncbi:MAG: hypothetical protein AB4290_24560, partial [Spirulina sp.]
MTQNDELRKSTDEAERESEQSRLSRRLFLSAGAGAIAALALPNPARADTQETTSAVTQLAAAISPPNTNVVPFPQPPNGCIGSRDNLTDLFVNHAMVQLPTQATSLGTVPFPTRAYGIKIPPYAKQPTYSVPGPVFRFKPSDPGLNSLNLEFINQLVESGGIDPPRSKETGI